jgi:DNA-binding transcriptional LysR family regulator
MNIELAKTFLEIVATGSFIRAAERLNIAQTTVSARIRLLEQQLGRPLFFRDKSGASLTPAGEQFLRYAPTFLQLWQRALQQVAIPEGHRAVITVSSEVSLWQPLLLDWIIWMRKYLRDIALRVHVDVPQDLINLVAAGVVDVAIMYAPPHRPGLIIDLLKEEELVLAASEPTKGVGELEYVHVDWGPDFALHHRWADFATTPGFFTNLGPLALTYVLSVGGAGYFRLQALQPHLESGRLYLVPDAPRFSYPIYVVHSADVDESILGPALSGLRSLHSSANDPRT